MKDLLLDLLPHAPQLGLYRHPSIPEDKLRAALGDYARGVSAEDVLVLYDATRLGNAKDGAVFTAEKLVFQNLDIEPVFEVRYADLVRVDEKRRLLGGRKVVMEVNQGRATTEFTLDFSGKPEAAQYVARFLNEAMLRGAEAEMEGSAEPVTDPTAVREALQMLVASGKLSHADFERIMQLIAV